MVWIKRSSLANAPVRYSFLGLILLIFSALFYIFALMTQVHTIISLSMLMTVVGATVYLYGLNGVKILSTPLLLLAMLIPVPSQLYIQATFPLQLKATQISKILIQWIGVPVFREGNILTIPDMSFEVVEACSGLRSMITLLTLGIIMGYFFLIKKVSKLVLVAACLPTAVLLNVIRISSMVLIFHFFKVDATEGTLHTIMGVSVFFIAILIIYLTMQGLEHWEKRSK